MTRERPMSEIAWCMDFRAVCAAMVLVPVEIVQTGGRFSAGFYTWDGHDEGAPRTIACAAAMADAMQRERDRRFGPIEQEEPATATELVCAMCTHEDACDEPWNAEPAECARFTRKP